MDRKNILIILTFYLENVTFITVSDYTTLICINLYTGIYIKTYIVHNQNIQNVHKNIYYLHQNIHNVHKHIHIYINHIVISYPFDLCTK